MGEAKRKLLGGSPKRKRFIYLMRLISKYADWQIIHFANFRFTN